jgi:2-polyprenyl-6-methoxyphenol hydroxylase-like FAD-dependent oxidoreductase
MTILIAGGGIGGLTAALSLHAAGMTNVVVFEAAPSIEPVGVGKNLPPHATRELIELRLGPGLAQFGVETSHPSYYDPSGHLIWAEPRGVQAGYNWPQYSVHRGKLQQIVLEAVVTRLGPASVRRGCRIVGVRSDDGGVEVSVQTREGARCTLTACVLQVHWLPSHVCFLCGGAANEAVGRRIAQMAERQMHLQRACSYASNVLERRPSTTCRACRVS